LPGVRLMMARAVLLTLLAALGLASPAAARTLPLGFSDPAFAGVPASRDAWLGRAAAEGADVVRIGVSWSAVAATAPPPGTAADDPANAAYDWSGVDGAVADARARGLQVMLVVTSAPRWAEGAQRPASAPPGSWLPDPGAFGAFARALALRYAGQVEFFQAWNEPNLSRYLSPQWADTGSGLRPLSPVWYRRMLNAFYTGIKGVDPSAVVLSAGTAPYGDSEPGADRLPPVRFTRELLCLTEALRTQPGCDGPAELDALAHHPYGVRGPTDRALDAQNAAIPDVERIRRVLDAARRAGTVAPAGRKALWVTELSWDSSPPDPTGVPVATQARWLAESFYLLWRQRVDGIVWFGVGDQAPDPSFGATNQSGVFYIDGRPKPSAAAFRFPFVAARGRAGHATAWGRAPVAGTAVVEERRRGRWVGVARRRVRQGATFTAAVAVERGVLRARVGAQASPSARVSDLAPRSRMNR
jgi:hypothetical protein